MATSATFTFIRGVTFERSFHYTDSLGADVSFAGKSLSFGYRSDRDTSAIYSLLSSDATTANGSYIHYTDQAGGEFDLKIADEDTLKAGFDEGTWWINIIDGGDIDRLTGGTLVIVNP